MTRTEFREYLLRFGRELKLRLQDVGPLAGLPVELDDALEVARAMRVLDQAAPSADELRVWYRNAGLTTSPGPSTPATQLYEAFDGLRESDLAELDESQLLLLAVRLSNWLTIARSLVAHRRLKRA
jgi:hypothetical protein